MSTPHNDTEQGIVEGLKMVIEEQRRDSDYLQKIYDRAGARENILLAAAFATIVYLYSIPAGSVSSPGIVERLFIPRDDYGLVIYVMAAAFFFYGLFKLMFNVFGDNIWETAYESSESSYSSSPRKVASYIKKRNDEAHKTNFESYKKRKYDLRVCFYCILISAIILIVIKTLT